MGALNECISNPWQATLRVGVTGTVNLTVQNFPCIANEVRLLLSELRGVLNAVGRQLDGLESNSDFPEIGRPPQIVLINSLAPGADQVVAEVGRELGIPLWVPLPLECDSYCESFEAAQSENLKDLLGTAASVLELDGRNEARHAAYAAAADITYVHSDLLIALIEGSIEGFFSSGNLTSKLVTRALSEGKPIILMTVSTQGPASIRAIWSQTVGDESTDRQQSYSLVMSPRLLRNCARY
jgi:hypothetical protein